MFITIEGIEGAGKSVAVKAIREYLNEQGIDADFTFEPGGTEIANEIRKTLKRHYSEEMHATTELLLFNAARNQHYQNRILPALEAGKVVVCDRFSLSTLAYQGGGRGLNEQTIETLDSIAVCGHQPDLILYLRVEPEIGLERARGRGELDRIELSGLQFFQRAVDRFDKEAKDHPNIVVINATKDINTVHNQIRNVVSHSLKYHTK